MSAKYRRQAIYTGRRLSMTGTVMHRYELLPGHQEVFYSRSKGVLIGHTYECNATSMAVRPPRTNAERIDNPQWDAEDAVVTARSQKRREEARLKRGTGKSLEIAIHAIQPLIRGVSLFHQRALAELLVSEATKRKYKK